MPFKVIEVGTNRQPVCHFLLVINSNGHLMPFFKQDHLLMLVWRPPPSLPHTCRHASARQHQINGNCLEVKREYYENCSVLGCLTQFSQSAAHSPAGFFSPAGALALYTILLLTDRSIVYKTHFLFTFMHCRK